MSRIQHAKAAATVPPILADVALEPYTFGSFTFSAIGLIVTGTPSIDEWTAVGHMLAVQARGLQLQVGDWLRIGEALYGELAAQAIDSRQWSEETVRNYRWVAEKVAPEDRRADLTFKHHRAVAKLPAREQRRWLKEAATADAEPWPVARLESAIKAGGASVEVAWHVVVECRDRHDQVTLQAELERDGRTCKALVRYGAKDVKES